jgi:hypothetical protein
MTHLFTRQSVNDPTRHEVAGLAPLHVPLWLVDVDCELYDSSPKTSSVEPPLLRVPRQGSTTSIATVRQFPTLATALLIGLTEARPLIRT